MKRIKELIGKVTEFGWEDPDSDGVGSYHIKIQFKRDKVPDEALNRALQPLLRRKVQVIQIGN